MSGAEEQEDEGLSSPSEAPESVESHIELRIHKLQNRLFFLQQMQNVTRRTSHDDEEVSELELVERELQDLLRQNQNPHELETVTHTGSGEVCISPILCKVETEGGVYTLPPLHFTPDILPQPMSQNTAPIPPEEPPAPPEEPPVPLQSEGLQENDEDIKQIEPADCLGKVGAFTLCPSCEQVVFTQTKKYNGESVCLMSCLMGFVGLCFIAFCVDHLKSVRHKCPQCKTTIHTYHPF